MLYNIGDIQEEFLIRNNRTTTDAFITDTILNDWVREAHRWVAGYKKWPFTEGRASTTFASLVTDEDGLLRGEYPEGWKSDSIRIMRIGGKSVDKKDYAKFRQFLEDNESATDRFFSDFGRQYFVNPNIDLSGTVTAWGQYLPANFDITDETSETIFTEGNDDGNEAVIEKAIGYAYKRDGKKRESLEQNLVAKQILDELWENIKQEQSVNQTTEERGGMYRRFDVLRGRGVNDDFFNEDRF